MFTEQQLSVIKYCTEECIRQQSGTQSVYDMVYAWYYAQAWAYAIENSPYENKISVQFIENIGTLMEPEDNASGFRQIPIYVGNSFHMEEKMQWERVPAALELLLESYYDGSLSPMEGYYVGINEKSQSAEDEFYYQFENIHPFRDGNGRTGKILYNYLRGTLDNPVMPPNFWGSSNP